MKSNTSYIRKKTYKIAINLLIIILLFSFMPTKSISESNKSEEMPFVLLGGNTLFLEYTNESFTFYPEAEDGDIFDLVERDYNIVQIGNIPILTTRDIETAVKIYANQRVLIKELINGKIRKRLTYIPDDVSFAKNFIYQSTTSGKVSFYIPETNTALLFAHPISTGSCSGVVYEAKVLGMLDEQYSIQSEKFPDNNPNIIGTITGQNKYGIVINYDANRIDTSSYRYIQIAKKDEVHLGKAYIYTDYGHGLDYYEITITSLIGEVKEDDYDYSYETIYSTNLEDDPITGNRFLFDLTDERFIKDEITYSVPGMSGSPIIQDGKLIGMNAYYESQGGIAVYACAAYDEVINDKVVFYHPLVLSNNSNPYVILGNYCTSMYMKDTGTYITRINGESYGLEVGDKVIAIDDSALIVGTNLTTTIKEKHEQKKSAIEITVIRNNTILDITLNENQNPILSNYNYNVISTGYISMIDPYTFRYAVGAFKNVINTKNPFSGVVWKGVIDLLDGNNPTGVSQNEIVGTITNTGSSAYGFIEPFSYDKTQLIEIASIDEIKNGEAFIYIYDGDYKNFLYIVKVFVTKKEGYIQLELNTDENIVDSFEECNIGGLPIIQNGKLIGVYATCDKDTTKGKAYYAITVYNEMMNISK